MPTKAAFSGTLPIGRPVNSEPIITVTVTATGNDITITENDLVGKQSRSRTYAIHAEDDEQFMIPDDLARSTQNFLVGIGQRMMYLKRYGFEREP